MQSKKFTYHWVIVIACFLLMASSIGITTNCFNLFTVEIMNDLGYTASQVQLMASIATIMMLVGSLIIGPLMKKFSMRVIMPIFGVIISLSFFLYSRCNSLTALYILSFFVGLGRSGVSVIPCGVLMNNWFQEKRGLATGIALAGSTGGGFVFVRIAKVIIASVGWRSAYMILGATAAIIIIPVSLFLIRENPSDKGLLPLGADSALQAAPTAKEEPKPVATGISRNKFLKTPAFWMLGILFFMISVVNMGVQSNISIYLSSQGHERAFIADVVSIVLLAQVPGKIILGQVYDKKGIKFGAVYCCVVYIVSIVALLLSANAFNGGLSRAIWANWGMALGCILFVLAVSRFYRTVSEKYGVMTIPEAYSILFGNRVRVVMMCIVALVNLILFSTQASAAASILGPMLDVDPDVLTWVITAVFVVMAVSGGLLGASWTGVLHAIILFAGAAIVAVAAVRSAGGMGAVRAAVPEDFFNIIGERPMLTLASALGMALSFLTSPNATNALFAARSEKTANRGILLAMMFALLPAIIGICARVTMPEIKAESALFLMANSIGEVYGGLIAVAIIAAICSTAPTLLVIVSGTITKDLYLPLLAPNATEKQQLRFSTAVIVVAAVVGTVIGMHAESILDNMLGAFQIRSIAGIVLLAALLWRRVNGVSAFWSLLGGGVTAAVWFFLKSPLGIAPLWAGALVCIAILIPVSLCSKTARANLD